MSSERISLQIRAEWNFRIGFHTKCMWMNSSPRFGVLSRSYTNGHAYITESSVARVFTPFFSWIEHNSRNRRVGIWQNLVRTFRPGFKYSRAGSNCCWAARCWRCSRSISAPPSASSSSVCFSCARRTGRRRGKIGSRICNRRSISTCSSPSPSRPATAGFPCTSRAIPSSGSWTPASRTPPSPAPRCNCTPASRRFHARAATRWTCGTRSCPRRTWSDSWWDRVSSGSRRGLDPPARRNRCCCRTRSSRWEWGRDPTTASYLTCSSTVVAELGGI